MPWCVVIGCKNNLKATKRSGKDVSYHIFPKNPQRRSAWINSLKRPFKFNANSSYICSEHFISDDFESNSLKEELLNIKVKRQLKKTAVPSINIPEYLEEPFDILAKELNSQNTSIIDKGNVQQYCAVDFCNNMIDCKSGESLNSKKVIFHKFPSDINLCEKWLEFCNSLNDPSKNYQNCLICSDHFNEDNYENKYITKSKQLIKQLKKDAVPTLNGGIKIINVRSINEESVKRERKDLVDKLLANYEEKQNSLNGIVMKYPNFFSPKINPKAKLGDKLKLLKALDNPEICSPPKKRNISPKSKSLDVPKRKKSIQINDQVIQVSPVQGGLMLHALPQIDSEKNNTDEEEIIIVTEDEASYVEQTLNDVQHKNNNTEVIVVTNLKETKNTSNSKKNLPKINNDKCLQNLSTCNNNEFTPLYSPKILLSEEKGCQVLFPCKGCEQRSFKINKLLRERTTLLKGLNQNSTWRDQDEISALKKMNGVLSLLLLHCVGEKYNKKTSPVRIDLIRDSVEKINRGWSMQNTSETLCKVLSANAYDEFANTFKIINET